MHDPESKPRSSKFQAGLTLLTNAMSAAVSLIYGIAAARWFGADARGQVVAFMYWPTMVTLLAMLGVPTATTYYAAHKREEAPEIVGTGVLMMLTSGFVFALAITLLIPYLIGGGSSQVVQAARLFALSTLFTATFNAAFHPFRVVGHMGLWNALRLGIDSTPLLALVGMVVLSSHHLVTYAISILTLQAVLMLTALVLMATTVGLGLSVSWVKPLARYGLPTVLAALPLLLNFRVDQAFLVRLVGRADLGNYATAVAWSQAVAVVTNVINYLTLPRVAGLRGEERVREYDHLLRLAVLLTILIVVPLMAVTPFMVPLLFGSDFITAGRLSLILLPSSAFMGLGSVSEEILRSNHLLRGPLIAQSVGMVVTVSALFVVVRLAGVWGAAIVSGVVYLLVALLLGWFLRSMGLPSTAPFLLPKRRQWNSLIEIPRAVANRFRA